MIETEILRLIDRDSKVDLSGLESDIWARVGNKIATRRLVSWQAVVMALAIVGSATAGSSLGAHGADGHALSALSGVENLAPSSLLFGARP